MVNVKRLITAISIVLLLLSPLRGTERSNHASAADAYCLDSNESDMLQLINDYRQQNDLPTLTASTTLGTAAAEHSQDMAAADYFDPIGSDGSTPEDRMTKAGYPLEQATETGESIYWGTGDLATADAALEWWQNSSDTDASLLNPAFQAIGIGVAIDPASGKTLWTVTFASFIDSAAGECSDDSGDGNQSPDQSDDATPDDSGTIDTGVDSASVPGETGIGPIVVIYQCPETANPDLGEFADCESIAAPDATLIETGTNATYDLGSASSHDEANNVYYWDSLAVGTYQIETGIAGTQWMMIQPDGFTPPAHADSETFDIAPDTKRFLVQVFVFGTGDTIERSSTPSAATDDQMADDSDGDGLSDEEESTVYQTDPANADSDEDGFTDGEEVSGGTDPLDSDSTPDSTSMDSDSDGLYDADEIDVYGTDPSNPDTDGDGVDDGQEVYDGTDPLDPSSFTS